MDEKFTMIISNKHVFIFKKKDAESIDLVAKYTPLATRKVRLDEVVDFLIRTSEKGEGT